MATRKSTIDWARIELEYLAGEDSIREIADRHEISDTAIRKRAKTENWQRAVRTPKSANLREPRRQTPPPSPETTVETPAIADRGRQLVARMLDELDAVTSHVGELEDIIEENCEDDRNGGRREALLKAVSLDGRANTLKTLALAFKTINEASAPQGKKAAQQKKADEVANRFRPLGPPSLKAVK